jgi:hypothetical protein
MAIRGGNSADKHDVSHEDTLTDWAESDAPTIQPGAIRHRGTAQSRAVVAAMLAEAAETPADIAALERAGGRPSLAADRPAGESPLWQVRAPQSLDTALRARAQAEGRTLSQVLRDAASEYLAQRVS